MKIQGVKIDPAALAGVKSLADLKKLEIFNHLPNEDDANQELWEALNPPKKVKAGPVKEEVKP